MYNLSLDGNGAEEWQACIMIHGSALDRFLLRPEGEVGVKDISASVTPICLLLPVGFKFSMT